MHEPKPLFVAETVRNRAAPGTHEARMVVLETDADGNPTIWCDPGIADLVRALNVGGLRTVASCEGHDGRKFGIVALADGRELLVLPDWATARVAERAVGTALRDRSSVEARAIARAAELGDNWDHMGEQARDAVRRLILIEHVQAQKLLAAPEGQGDA